ncbi:hypothetical protein TELCIR_02542 [Teladorsagia circumcincta]|uniref:Alpha galactosidase C-terminal domain-containing protein n=1 Tax=Teladorsagia circumcincta TaxID=45464 RepID=A0A2G9UYS9_TELCI|nr:hypothetical protein TELCIR_02542 [Teladorsagia circumcincta]
MPVYGSDTSFAIAVLNRNNRANDVEFKLRNLGLTNDRGYILKDLWSNAPMVNASPDDMIRFRVPATGAAMYRAELRKPNRWFENNRLREIFTNRVPSDF